MYHFVYKTTSENGKYYIGRHSTTNLNDGYLGSGVWIQNSIKAGRKLRREILEFCDNEESLRQIELKYLTEHYGQPKCKNLVLSASGISSEWMKENNPMNVPEYRVKIQGVNNPQYGKYGTNHPAYGNVLSEETKKKMSQNNAMKTPPNRKKVATVVQQTWSSRKPTGLPPGVSYEGRKYRARFGKGGKIHLGTFDTIEEASNAYQQYISNQEY